MFQKLESDRLCMFVEGVKKVYSRIKGDRNMLFSHWGVNSCHLVRQEVHCVNRRVCDTVSFSRWVPVFHKTCQCHLHLPSSVDGDGRFLLIVCVYHDTLSMLSAMYYALLEFLFMCHFWHILEFWMSFNIM